MVTFYVLALSGDIGIALSILMENFHFLLFGILFGMIVGVIPGMSGVITLTILLPFSMTMDTYPAFIMMSGALGATTFTGSITAILINTPGTAANAATLIDGYPMTRAGKSSTAITASAVASASGAVLAGIMFILLIPVLLEITLRFGPSEIFWIVLGAIIIVPLILGDRPIFTVGTALLGSVVAFVGAAPQTSEPRFTFGVTQLWSGIEIVSVLIGLFAISEMIRLSTLQRNTIIDTTNYELSGSRVNGLKNVLENKLLWLKSTAIGIFVGVIPGAGGTAASFMAYGSAVSSSKDPDKYGNGAIEGVIAPEAANDSKDIGQLIPTLGLGIPGSSSMAIFLAALLLQGILPGPQLVHDEIHLVLIILLSLMASNILTSVLGLISVEKITGILNVPIPVIASSVLVLAFSATFIANNQIIDVWLALIFGMLGLIMMYLNISRVPFIIGFILASILEQQYFYAVSFADGDVVAALFSGTLNWMIIGVIILSIIPIIRNGGLFNPENYQQSQ